MHMRFALAGVSGLVLAACGGGGTDTETGSSPEAMDSAVEAAGTPSAADTYITNLELVADALESVEDEQSAAAAAAVIEEATDRLTAIADQLEGPQAALIFISRQGEFLELQQRISTSLADLYVNDPELGQQLSDAMDSLPAPGE